MRCKRCGSTNISVETQQKSGYSWKKGFLGSLLFGSGGAAAGVNGKNKTSTTYRCMACGLMGDFITVVMDGGPEGEINSALRYNRVSALKSLKSKYRNIEWTPPVEATPKPSAPIASTPQSAEPPEEFEIQNGVLTKYRGKERYVEIPNGIIGIGDEAFAYCKSILSVVIPKSVTSIGKNAFIVVVILLPLLFRAMSNP